MDNSFASGVKKVFFGLIVALSGSTSFLFFVEIFSLGRGVVADVAISTILNGGIGVLITDGAALAWLQVYLRASDNNSLRSLAITGAMVGMVASAVASFGYLLMVGANYYTVDPTWRSYVIWVMAAIIVSHFVLVFLSGYKATSAQIDERMAGMLAEGTDEMLKLTDQRFRDQIPTLAAKNADELTRRLAGRFASLTAAGGDVPTPTSSTWTVVFVNSNGQPWNYQVVGTQADAIQAAKETRKDYGINNIAVKNENGHIVWPEHAIGQEWPPRKGTRHTYGKSDNKILKPSRKYGLSRKGHMIDESDDIEALIRNPAYDSYAYIVDRNGAVIENLDRERVARPTPASNGSGYSPE